MAGTRRFDFISSGVRRRTWAVPTITISPRLHVLAAQIVPELCKPVSLEETRAQGKPGARCTRSLARKKKAHERSHHRFTETVRPSLRNGFNGLYRALLGDEFVLSPSSTD